MHRPFAIHAISSDRPADPTGHTQATRSIDRTIDAHLSAARAEREDELERSARLLLVDLEPRREDKRLEEREPTHTCIRYVYRHTHVRLSIDRSIDRSI